LWLWGTNYVEVNSGPWPGFRAFEPGRLGSDSDWTRITSGFDCNYAWKRDGTAWAFHDPESKWWGDQWVAIGSGFAMERAPGLDHTQWRSLSHLGRYEIGVREDGTLWAREPSRTTGSKTVRDLSQKMTPLGDDAGWTSLVRIFEPRGEALAGLKSDGTLWTWNFRGDPLVFDSSSDPAPPIPRPVRLGTHADWKAVSSFNEGFVSLAADGSLWHWNARTEIDWSQPMLMPSRHPAKIGNIFDIQDAFPKK
jgi:hypothetical protein